MVLLLVALLAVLTGGITLWPYLVNRNQSQLLQPKEITSRFRRQRESIYIAIQSLQSEYQLGQVNEREYQLGLDEYRRQAAVILRNQEALEKRLKILDLEQISEKDTSQGSESGYLNISGQAIDKLYKSKEPPQ